MNRYALVSGMILVASAGYTARPLRAAAKPVPACTLLTYNDLKSLPQKDTVNQSTSWAVKGGQASACMYAKGLLQVVLVTGPGSEQGYNEWFKRQVKAEVKKQ